MAVLEVPSTHVAWVSGVILGASNIRGKVKPESGSTELMKKLSVQRGVDEVAPNESMYVSSHGARVESRCPAA